MTVSFNISGFDKEHTKLALTAYASAFTFASLGTFTMIKDAKENSLKSVRKFCGMLPLA